MAKHSANKQTHQRERQTTKQSHDTNMVEDIIYATGSTRTLITRIVIDEMREMSRMSSKPNTCKYTINTYSVSGRAHLQWNLVGSLKRTELGKSELNTNEASDVCWLGWDD